MINQSKALLADFLTLPIPDSRIAVAPRPNRTEANMLVLDRQTGKISFAAITDLPNYVLPNDAWIVNRSRVRKARSFAIKDTGGRVELIWHRQEADHTWLVFGQTSKLKVGSQLRLDDLTIQVQAIDGMNAIVKVDGDIEHWLSHHGEVPLPPYIRKQRTGQPTVDDTARYQTVYAQELGSIAAPTAGLHFSHQLMADMRHQGGAFAEVILHVGPATFTEVQADNIDNVQAAPEYASIPEDTVQLIKTCQANNGRICTVGTTSLRTLEGHWPQTAIVEPTAGWVDVTLRPGYASRWDDVLLTNFHMPNTSLRLLVASFAGTELAYEAYRMAIANPDYQFFSYGDAMLII